MSSEELKDHLVDLLYDDELDDETRASVRREVEDSDEAREDLEQFESMLGMIRESAEAEGPSDSVHDSIMAAAREHAEQTTRERAEASERAPRVPAGDGEQGIWARISSHQVTQLALAACAILGAGFLFYLFNMQADESAPTGAATSQQAKFKEAAEETSEPLSLDEQEVAQAEPEPAEQEEQGMFERDSRAEPAAEKPLEGAEIDEMKDAEEPQRRSRIAPRKKKSADKQPEQRPTKKSAPKLDTSGDDFDPFGGEGSDSSANQVFGTRDSPKAEGKKSEDSDRGRAANDNSSIAGTLGLADDASDERSAPRPKPSSGSTGSAYGAADAEAPSEEESRADSDDTAGTSIADVEQAYRSGDNERVVRSADDIINSGNADGEDMARALELQAFAQRRLERLDEADRTLARLQSEYPDYKPSTIQSARADIARQQRDEREAQRRKRRPAKEDSMESAPETESMDEPVDAME
ncbi:MAG: hypothetical protein ACQEVA_00855 [Myxococcota bacterium]